MHAESLIATRVVDINECNMSDSYIKRIILTTVYMRLSSSNDVIIYFNTLIDGSPTTLSSGTRPYVMFAAPVFNMTATNDANNIIPTRLLLYECCTSSYGLLSDIASTLHTHTE
jgi:hypothetical protein